MLSRSPLWRTFEKKKGVIETRGTRPSTPVPCPETTPCYSSWVRRHAHRWPIELLTPNTHPQATPESDLDTFSETSTLVSLPHLVLARLHH